MLHWVSNIAYIANSYLRHWCDYQKDQKHWTQKETVNIKQCVANCEK